MDILIPSAEGGPYSLFHVNNLFSTLYSVVSTQLSEFYADGIVGFAVLADEELVILDELG